MAARDTPYSKRQKRTQTLDTEWPIRMDGKHLRILEKLYPLAERLATTRKGHGSGSDKDGGSGKGVFRHGNLQRAVVKGSECLRKHLAHLSQSKVALETATTREELKRALILAFSLRSAEMVRMLLGHGAQYTDDVNVYSLTIAAIDVNCQEILHVFLEQGSLSQDETLLGTCLHAACRTGNIALLDRLLALGTLDVNHGCKLDGSTPLQTAVVHGHLEAVTRLVQAGADVNLQPDQAPRRTALHYGAFRGHDTIIRYLLQHGADRHVQDAQGLTPIMAAINFQHPISCEALWDDMDVNVPWVGTEKPLPYCAQKGFYLCLEYLMEKGADPSLPCLGNGYTPLMLSVHDHNERFFRALSKDPRCRSTVNTIGVTKDDTEHTALSLAFETKHSDLWEPLVEMGADVDIWLRDHGQKRPLVILYVDDLDILQFLLTHGADPNVVPPDGESVLSQVAEYPSQRADRLLASLLNHNLDLDTATCVKGQFGTTPMEKILAKCDVDDPANNYIPFVRRLVLAGCAVTVGMQAWAAQRTVRPLDDETRDLLDYILRAKSPRSLQELSRLAALKNLPHNQVNGSIGELEISEILKDWLRYETFTAVKYLQMTRNV